MAEFIKNKTITVSATIVLYKESTTELSKTIDSFLAIPQSKKLFLVDNSPTDLLKDKFNHTDIEYIFVGKNIGFGAAHNRVIDKIKNLSSYHLVLNPDVTFQPNVISDLIEKVKESKKIILISPKVLFPNGDHQYTSRRYPSFSELVIRRLSFLNIVFPSVIKKGE